MRKRLLTLMLLPLAPIVPLAAVAWWQAHRPPPKPEPTIENFRRLHYDMTVAEAVAILGEPDDIGDVIDGKYEVCGHILIWRRVDCKIDLRTRLDTDGERIMRGRYRLKTGPEFRFTYEPKSWWQRLRDWLPW